MLTEELTAPGIGIKESVERLQDRVCTLVAPVTGFNRPDGDNNFPVNTNLFFHPVKNLFVLNKFTAPGLNIFRGYKVWVIFIIGFGFALFVHEFQNSFLYSQSCKNTIQF